MLTHGNQETMNLHPVLFQNLRESSYFRQLGKLETVEEVVVEASEKVSSLEPFLRGNFVATAFCVLFRLWQLRLTDDQLSNIIDHDNACVRAIGFLYLRYVCKPADLWQWFEPYLDDTQKVQVRKGALPLTMTIGDFCRKLITDIKFEGTILPRIPVPIQRQMEEKMNPKKPSRDAPATSSSSSRNDRDSYSRRSRSRSRSPSHRRRYSRSRSPEYRRARSPDYRRSGSSTNRGSDRYGRGESRRSGGDSYRP